MTKRPRGLNGDPGSARERERVRMKKGTLEQQIPAGLSRWLLLDKKKKKRTRMLHA